MKPITDARCWPLTGWQLRLRAGMFPYRVLRWWLSGKESACQCRRHRFNPWVGKISWSRKWQTTPVVLPGKYHGQRSLGGYSPPGHKTVEHDWATKLCSQDFSVNVTLYASREVSPNVFWDNLASGVCFCLVLIETFFFKKSTLLRYNLHNLHSRHMFECIVWRVLTNAYMCICDLSKKKKKT